MPVRSKYSSSDSGMAYQDGGSSVHARDSGGRNFALARVRRMRAATVSGDPTSSREPIPCLSSWRGVLPIAPLYADATATRPLGSLVDQAEELRVDRFTAGDSYRRPLAGRTGQGECAGEPGTQSLRSSTRAGEL